VAAVVVSYHIFCMSACIDRSAPDGVLACQVVQLVATVAMESPNEHTCLPNTR
jgi:hypothetical protein